MYVCANVFVLLRSVQILCILGNGLQVGNSPTLQMVGKGLAWTTGDFGPSEYLDNKISEYQLAAGVSLLASEETTVDSARLTMDVSILLRTSVYKSVFCYCWQPC